MAKSVGVALLFVMTVSGICLGRKEETLQELMARADAAAPSQQPDLCMQVAEHSFKEGSDAYKAGKYAEFHANLQNVLAYSDKARAAAISSGKHLKSTEIKIRKVSERLKDLKLNVDFDDETAVQAVVDKLEGFRTELLKSMFGSKSHD